MSIVVISSCRRLGLSFVGVEPFLDDRLVVLVQRNAAGVVSTRTLEIASLDEKRVVAAVAILIDHLPME